jgi:16S rRNA (adenine1518-N6/adenine1519-N6)-dimethyltransferase
MTLTEVRQLLVDLDLRPSKVLGQNFLIDQNIRDLIIRQADIRADETVLEIGPGIGALTQELLKRARRLITIEKDPRLAEYLRHRYPGLELIQGDAVEVLRSSSLILHPSSFKVVSNLPYSVSTPILECFVEGAPKPRTLVLTVQREVAQRLAATPRHKDYGALTVFTQLYYHVTIVHIVSPRCFFPMPHVDSAIVLLERRDPRVTLAEDAPFHDIVRRGFSQRRKMLRNLLDGTDRVTAAFAAVGIPLTARAEELHIEQWIALANALRPAAPAP